MTRAPQRPDSPHRPDPDDTPSNRSGNPHLSDVVARRIARRPVLAGAGLAVAGFLAGPPAASAAARSAGSGSSALGFAAVPVGTADDVVVPEGYTVQVFVPWGEPLAASGPAWHADASDDAAAQARQVGMHHDGMAFFPQDDAGDRGLLVMNHEYVDQTLLYPDGPSPVTVPKVRKALAAHGVSVLGVRRRGATWERVHCRHDRRITGATPMAFSGPAAGSELLDAGHEPLGTLNNCSMGKTPWGTYLTCEENWNNYFGTADATWAPDDEQDRYGIAADAEYPWYEAVARFDVAAHPKEPRHFGWVVEIDPFSPRSTPVKRTALGRFKHESATVTTAADGRVVVYTGDDQDGEYVYKFVSARPWSEAVAAGDSPLDEGTLYVATFADDGTGAWSPLVHGTGALTVAKGWADQAAVLVRTRDAADAVGATALDRAEWVAVHPATGDVYLTLTNGAGNGGAVNPRTPNPYGSVVRWTEEGSDAGATAFTWEIFLLAGDPALDDEVTLDAEDVFGSPDGLAFDPDGRLWICTDVSNSSQTLAAKGYGNIGNNMLLACDPDTGDLRRFLVGPRGAEITGPVFAPDGRTLFVNVQHPGEASAAWGEPTAADPRAVSNWPDFDPDGRPRAATLVVRRADGGVVGT